MISVYARLFDPTPRSGFSDGDSEHLLFEIPNSDSSKHVFLTATVNSEMGTAGNFEFSVDPESPWYDIWKHMRTLLRVEYDGDTIFYGRVLTIDRDMFRTKTIHCEGAFTFFMDSVFESEKKGYTITVYEYLQKLIEAHNECMNPAPEKKIYLGEVPGHYSSAVTEIQQIKNDRQKFAAGTGYKAIKDHLEELATDYGGYMRVRYNKTDGKLYLDWMKVYFQSSVNTQNMTVYSNIVDLSDTVEINNIFTHVIPVGKNNKYIGGGSSPSGGGENGKYTITVVSNGHGTGRATVASTTVTEAYKGTKIYLMATPDPGWWLKGFTSSDATITGNSFEMPANNVTVTVSFQTFGGIDFDDPIEVT